MQLMYHIVHVVYRLYIVLHMETKHVYAAWAHLFNAGEVARISREIAMVCILCVCAVICVL